MNNNFNEPMKPKSRDSYIMSKVMYLTAHCYTENIFNELMPEHNDCHVPYDIFNSISSTENMFLWIEETMWLHCQVFVWKSFTPVGIFMATQLLDEYMHDLSSFYQ